MQPNTEPIDLAPEYDETSMAYWQNFTQSMMEHTDDEEEYYYSDDDEPDETSTLSYVLDWIKAAIGYGARVSRS
jgi:hypothetical protein